VPPLFLCSHPQCWAAADAEPALKLNDEGYFEAPGLNVTIFADAAAAPMRCQHSLPDVNHPHCQSLISGMSCP